MTAAFQYRPKFVDIRVRPPKEGETRAEDDVFTLKPGEKPCEAEGCRSAAAAKAPKGRGLEGQFYEFCAPHAAEYNKSWDYFAGMSEAEIEQHRADAAHGGHRPEAGPQRPVPHRSRRRRSSSVSRRTTRRASPSATNTTAGRGTLL